MHTLQQLLRSSHLPRELLQPLLDIIAFLQLRDDVLQGVQARLNRRELIVARVQVELSALHPHVERVEASLCLLNV